MTKEKLKKYSYDKDSNTYYYIWTDDYGQSFGIEYNPEDNAHWIFDEATQTISLYTDSGYYTYTYRVTMNEDNKSWIGKDEKGRTYVFTRINE